MNGWFKQLTRAEVIILSDTFREFVAPLMPKLGYPTLFCHSLVLDDEQRIINYQLRQVDQKRQAINALRSLNFRTVAAGDSYNDITMLQSADRGIFFKPTQKITEEYPDFHVTQNYEELKQHLCEMEGYAE